MPKKPAIFFVISFILSFVLGSLATPALARSNFAIRRRPQAGFFFADAHITASPTLIRFKTASGTGAIPTPHPLNDQPLVETASPSPSPSASTAQKPIVLSTHSTEIKDFIQSAINDFRLRKGLAEVKPNTETCAFAKTRAGEIAQNFNHDGFTSRVNSKTLPYPSYHQVTENIAETTNYKQVVAMWIASPGHRDNLAKDTPFVCVELQGNYYVYEGWQP